MLNHGPNIVAKCTAGKSQCLFVYSLICVKYLTVVNNSILFHCCVFSRVIRHLWRNGAGSEVLGNVQRSLFQSLVFFKIIKILIPLLVSFFVSQSFIWHIMYREKCCFDLLKRTSTVTRNKYRAVRYNCQERQLMCRFRINPVC